MYFEPEVSRLLRGKRQEGRSVGAGEGENEDTGEKEKEKIVVLSVVFGWLTWSVGLIGWCEAVAILLHCDLHPDS